MKKLISALTIVGSLAFASVVPIAHADWNDNYWNEYDAGLWNDDDWSTDDYGIYDNDFGWRTDDDWDSWYGDADDDWDSYSYDDAGDEGWFDI